jgi:transposase InsO family protein
VAWCGDVTFIPTDEGWLYLASVLDLTSRHLLGWSMDERHDAGLVTDALQAAVATRGRSTMDSTIFHTDRGSEGGFNWSSQHPEQRGVDGTTTGLGCCGDRKAADAVAWPAAAGAA